MPQRMQAEILFPDPSDVKPCIAALTELGFEVEVLDWVDPYGPTVWINAFITTDVAKDRILDWVSSLVEPLHGDCVEAGLADPPRAAANPLVAWTQLQKSLLDAGSSADPNMRCLIAILPALWSHPKLDEWIPEWVHVKNVIADETDELPPEPVKEPELPKTA